MSNIFEHAYNAVYSLFRENSKRNTRSAGWRAVEKAYIAKHSTCEACGSTTRLQVHHVHPFHLHPELELNPNNLICLCMDSSDCHLKIGHGDDWKAFNPNVRQDSAVVHNDGSLYKQIEEKAKAKRLYEDTELE